MQIKISLSNSTLFIAEIAFTLQNFILLSVNINVSFKNVIQIVINS